MTTARGLAIVRIAFACVVAFGIVAAPPNLALIFASFATHADVAGAGVGRLGSLIVDALYAGPLRYGALVAASIFGALATFALVERRARRLGASHLGSLLAAVLVALCSLDTLRAGGGTATLAFAAAVVLLLEETTLLARLALALVTIVWCNIDASGLLAPAFALVAAVGGTLDRDPSRRSGSAWVAAALTLAATLATPLGLAYPAHALAALGLDGASADYALWAPADIAPHGYRLGVMLLAVSALAAGLRGAAPRASLLAAFSFVVTLASGALVPIFGVVAAPMVARAFLPGRDDDGAAAARPPHRRTDFGSALAVIAIVALAGGLAVRGRDVPLAASEPYAAIANLARAGSTHRLFCSDPAWCDAAIASGLGVVAGGRIANAPKAVRDAQIAIVRARKVWRAKIVALGVDAVVARANSPLATLLAESHWTRFAGNDAYVILLRPAAA